MLEAWPAAGPFSDTRVAIFMPKLPKEAKKIRRLIGFLNLSENAKVLRTKAMPTSEKKLVTRSAITSARVWPSVNDALMMEM